jgi:predicted short-subunit dehydrogenase-like oxidoreductase (DUF2520 family)
MRARPVIGVIGAGQVGQTLARLLFQAGYEVGAIYSRRPEPAEALASLVQSRVTAAPAEVLEAVDLLLLTVPDDAIRSLALQLAHGELEGKAVVHSSGALDSHSLDAVAECGAMVGSLHPIYPFAGVEDALKGLPGAAFAVESDSEVLMDHLGDMIRSMNGTILRIASGEKALYHAALVIASNYTVVLYDIARRLLLSLGPDEAAADGALNTLLAGTAANLRSQGLPQALTGPLVRRDIGTLTAHLAALHRYDDQLAALYRELARWALPILEARDLPTDAIEELLNQDERHATDHT